MKNKDEKVGLVCVVPEPGTGTDLLHLVGKTVVITDSAGRTVFARVALAACVDDFGINFDPRRRK